MNNNLTITIHSILHIYRNGFDLILETGELDPGIFEQILAEEWGIA